MATGRACDTQSAQVLSSSGRKGVLNGCLNGGALDWWLGTATGEGDAPSPAMNGATSNGTASTTLVAVPTAAPEPMANGEVSPDKPWHQLDADMCLVPKQWTLPTCSATLSHMLLTSNRPPATLPVLTRDEAASMTPPELRMHLNILKEQLELLQSVNLARPVTPLFAPVWCEREHTVLRGCAGSW